MARKTQKKKITKQIIVFVGLVLKDNKVLMTQRYEPDCEDAHLKWELPGGKVDIGETPAEAVKREILEETGVLVKTNSLFPYVQTFDWNYDWGIQQTFIFCYQCTFVKQTPISADHRVHAVNWINVKDVTKLKILPGVKEFINLLLEKR